MNAAVARSALVFGLAFAALLAGCPSNGSAQTTVPRFEPAECVAPVNAWAASMGVECGWLIVPELRERRNGPTIKLPVARRRATEPDGSPPLVYLHGGPGGQGQFRQSQNIFNWAIARTRDIIVYDQRGAGLSEPRLCPQTAQAILSRAENSTEDPQLRWDSDARECVAELRAQGVEPLAYTTQNNLLDLIDLRRTLGYERWDVYGVSYGGVLAQEAMRQDSGAVRAAVLAYSGTTGLTTQVEGALSYERSLDHMYDACADQATCRAAFPALREDFRAAYQQLQANPVDLSIPRTSGSSTVRMDGDRFVRELRCQLSNPRSVRRVPILIHALRGEERQTVLQLLAGGCGTAAFNPTIELVMCDQSFAEDWVGAAKAVRAQLRPEFRAMVGDNPECKLWQERFADATSQQPVKSDIPTLLITGEFDERSPTDHSKRIAAGLSRARLYEMPGESHGGTVAGCHESILFQFLENPIQEPDASCMAEMPRVVFETERLTIPTMVLNISSTPGASTAFNGSWEAEIPNAPQPVRFNLTIVGTSVNGALSPQSLEVFDGTVQGNTLRVRIKTPNGLSTVTFIGELVGEEIRFTRDIEIPPGAPEGGRWIFGVQGVRTFTATRGG